MLYQYCGWLQERVKLFHAFHNAIHLHYKAARTITEREFVFHYAIIYSKSHFRLLLSLGLIIIAVPVIDQISLFNGLSITKICSCNVFPLEPHFYIAKLGYAVKYLFFIYLLILSRSISDHHLIYVEAVLTNTQNLWGFFWQK